MSALQAAFTAGIAGMLCGIAIELVMNISLHDAIYRILVLASAAGLMGALVAWLNEGLNGVEHSQDEVRRP